MFRVLEISRLFEAFFSEVESCVQFEPHKDSVLVLFMCFVRKIWTHFVKLPCDFSVQFCTSDRRKFNLTDETVKDKFMHQKVTNTVM